MRAIPPGDIDAAVKMLSARYEDLSGATHQLIRLEGRIETVSEMIRDARNGHWGWLETVFAEWLKKDRKERVAALFWATEIYAWITLRKHFGMSRRAAENVMRDTLHALTERWERGDR